MVGISSHFTGRGAGNQCFQTREILCLVIRDVGLQFLAGRLEEVASSAGKRRLQKRLCAAPLKNLRSPTIMGHQICKDGFRDTSENTNSQVGLRHDSQVAVWSVLVLSGNTGGPPLRAVHPFPGLDRSGRGRPVFVSGHSTHPHPHPHPSGLLTAPVAARPPSQGRLRQRQFHRKITLQYSECCHCLSGSSIRR
ncbi:hypothetical protein NDU88_003383 [Pleurodeles waltl]|uniref:Uncharacterized protein n=1 Tax=Pleurodeles waltl TaxID=8319 RepID=A0AAV7SFY1_PLEWA|nr:hypothetical protein NDU88_003383 [Pleurodeles waltl]